MKYILFITLFALILLGTWQVCRWYYKQDIMLNLQKTAINIPDTITKNLNYTKVNIKFFIKSQDVLYVYSGKNGYYVLIPVEMPNNTVVLLNIGTILNKGAITINDGENIEGIILFNFKKPLFISNYDQNSDTWLGIDTAAMGKKLNLKLEPYIIWAEHSNIENVKDNGPISIYNRHLEYIVTWYGLALILIAYLVYTKIKVKSFQQ